MIQFKKLRLSGFKSFLYPTEVEIGPGMNGVVGPNGCGKSNLLEAMGWVMGESSAKKLRGGEMDDVIFGGTDNKASRNNAEVTVILDNSMKAAPAQFNHLDEIEVTRRIERGSGSDYKINGKTVRAKDVQLLFADLVSGANSPALVSQGRITALISAKPTDRRKILEDAAGISGLHARKHEAELKLKGTSTNLERLEDVIGGFETQLTALKKQARQASRYKNILDQIKEIEAGIAYLKWLGLEQETKAAKEKFDSLEDMVREKISQVNQLTTRQAEQASILPDLRRKEADIAARLQKLVITKEQFELDIQRIEQEKRDTQTRIEQISQDIEREQRIITENKDRRTALGNELVPLESESGKETDILAGKERALSTAKADLSAQEEHILALQNKIAEQDAELKSLHKQKLSLEEQIAGQSREISSQKSSLEDIKRDLPDAALLTGAQQEIATLEQNIVTLRQELESHEQQRPVAEAEKKKAEDKKQELSAQLHKLNAESEALEKILDTAQDHGFKPVLHEIEVEKGIENALAVALGDSLDLPSNPDAPAYWQALPPFAQGAKLPVGAQDITALVKGTEVLARALSQIGLVDDVETGQKLASALLPGQILVTRQGDFWRWDGLTAKADAPNAAAVRLRQKNRLNEIKKEIKDVEKLVDQARKQVETTSAKFEQVKEAEYATRNKINNLDRQLREKRALADSIRDKHDEFKDRIQSIETSITLMRENIERAENSKKDVIARIEQFQSLDEIRAELDAERAKGAALRVKVEELSLDLQRFEIEKTGRLRRIEDIKTELASLEQKIQGSDTRLKELEERLKTEQEKGLKLDNAPAQSPDQISNLIEKISQEENLRRQATDALIAAETALKEVEMTLRQNEKHMADLREERAHVQGLVSTAKSRMEALYEEALEKFETRPEALGEVSALARDQDNLPDIPELQRKLEKLLNERDNMGPVNLRADIEAEEIEKEITRLTNEKEELVEAINKLRAAIGKLNKEARARLLQAFGTVDNHFQKLFTRLFKGGQAYLKLTDSDDPLEAGLEIFAQPPGKKLQNLTLLSGGEQTLTSIALVFAMFLTNPSPICVLDEIDAALDDANVDRVCSLLEEIAAKGETRFLVISHHRMTISRMDRLYGVTMSEKGISQLVSVDMHQSDLLDKVA